jgi:hypothetical protein
VGLVGNPTENLAGCDLSRAVNKELAINYMAYWRVLAKNYQGEWCFESGDFRNRMNAESTAARLAGRADLSEIRILILPDPPEEVEAFADTSRN